MTDPDLNPTTNPDAQSALSNAHSVAAVILLPLTSGNIAVLGRDFQLHSILYEAPTLDDIRRFSREIHAKLAARKILDAEAAFHGEPDEKQMARDIRNTYRQPLTPRASRLSDESMEL